MVGGRRQQGGVSRGHFGLNWSLVLDVSTLSAYLTSIWFAYAVAMLNGWGPTPFYMSQHHVVPTDLRIPNQHLPCSVQPGNEPP